MTKPTLDEAVEILADESLDRGLIAEALLTVDFPSIEGGVWLGDVDIPGLDMDIVRLKHGNNPLAYVAVEGQTVVLQSSNPDDGNSLTEAGATFILNRLLEQVKLNVWRSSLLESVTGVGRGGP